MLVSTAAIILYDPADNEPPVSDKKKASYSFASTMGSYGGGIYGGVGGMGKLSFHRYRTPPSESAIQTLYVTSTIFFKATGMPVAT
jgi:hypothetical protein